MDKWIGDAVGKMHIHRITQADLAKHLGVGLIYGNKILNGVEKVTPKNAESRIMTAIDEIIKERA